MKDLSHLTPEGRKRLHDKSATKIAITLFLDALWGEETDEPDAHIHIYEDLDFGLWKVSANVCGCLPKDPEHEHIYSVQFDEDGNPADLESVS